MTRMTGVASRLDVVDLITHLTATANSGTSILTVDAPSVLSPTGGTLVLDETPLTYTSVNGTVNLSAALGATYEAGLPVRVPDMATYWVQVQPDDPEAGAITAILPTDMTGWFSEGVLDPAAPVELELVGSQWRVLRRLDSAAEFDGSVIDPATIPTGQAFSTDAPVDTDGYPEGYGWWQVVDDEVVGFWRLVGGVWTSQTIVTADALNADNVLVEVLNGKLITGTTVQTRTDVTPSGADSGHRGAKLGFVDGVEGLFVYDEAGNTFLKAVPAEGMAVVAGEVKATTTTVTEGTSLGGTTEITRHPDGSAGVVRLTAYTTAPKSAPTVTTGYDSVQFTNDGMWGNRRGWVTDGTYWYTARIGGTRAYVEKWNATGALVSTTADWVGANSVLGVAVDTAGGRLFLLREQTGGASGTFGVVQYATSTLAYVSAALWNHADGMDDPTIGYDPAASEILVAQSRPTNADKVRIRRYTMPAFDGDPLVNSATAAVDTDAGWDVDLSAVYYGSGDFGSARFVLANAGAADIRVTSTAGVFQSDRYWPSGMSQKVGVAWNGSAFVSMDTEGVMRTYTGVTSTTAADMTKWVSNTLANATYETDQSPRAKIVMPKRSKMFVTTSAINTGGTNAPDRVKVYVGQGSSDPGRTAMWKQTDPAVGVISTSYDSLGTSGTNPVATNGFAAAAGTVQRLELADGTVLVDGLGAGTAWTTYTPTFTATTTSPTLGNFTRSGRYARLGRNTIAFSIVITCNAASGFGSGNYAFGLPVAARDSEEFSPVGSQSGPNRAYIGRRPVTGNASEFQLLLTSDFTVATSVTTAMASGTVIRISGTYEAA